MTEAVKVMNVWREKLVACGIHFLATLVLAVIAATLIFFVWYPPPFSRMLGGEELFLLVVGIDLVLGPLMSLVIYDSRKSRRALIIDYSFVSVVQIAALIYGVWIMSGARPVYVAFVKDRFEVVQASDLTPEELAAARDPRFATRPLTGPRLISVVVPEEDKKLAMSKTMEGKDMHVLPRFYVPFEAELANMRRRAKTLEELVEKHPKVGPELEKARREAGIPVEHQRWLPLHHSQGFWTVVIDERTGQPVSYVDFDPY